MKVSQSRECADAVHCGHPKLLTFHLQVKFFLNATYSNKIISIILMVLLLTLFLVHQQTQNKLTLDLIEKKEGVCL